jgi:hypothetical protein
MWPIRLGAVVSPGAMTDRVAADRVAGPVRTDLDDLRAARHAAIMAVSRS